MNRLAALGIAVVVVIYLLFSSLYVVNPRQQAVVTRFGQITQVQTKPGLYFKLPTSLVDDVQIIDNRLLRYDIANMTLQVKDGKFYVVDAFVTYRIADARKFRERALGSLDLVVTSDTAIAHLAGALGAPVWVALQLVPNWRWMLKREDSPWYPTMRLFRQTAAGQWPDVFERIAQAVQKLRSAPGQSR